MPEGLAGQHERDDAKDRVALVTGANRGIGLEVCRRLAVMGMRVVLAARDEEKGKAARQTLREEGLDVATIRLDVDEPESIDQARRHIAEGYSRLDVLVNNAAVYLDEGVSVFDLDEGRLDRTLTTNFWGPFRTCRAFIPLMMNRGYGRVVNVSSGSGSLADMTGTTAAYRVSKTALNALTRIFAAEVYAANVKVNSVCPGWVQTAMGGPFADRAVDDAAETIIWLATLGRRGPTAGFFRDRRSIPW